MFARHLFCLTILGALTAFLRGEAPTIVEPQAESLVSGEIGITMANQYITRGFVVQGDGTFFQPHFDLIANFYEGDGFIKSASAFIGLW